jgi:tetratricopeptide (TPR) repeat protein
MKSACLTVALTLLFWHSADGHQPDQKIAADAAESPATLVPGLGALHHPVATSRPEAQKFFDQGLTFVYAFNHPEAVRSFERAAQLDPQMTMAYWGIALALGSNINSEIDSERERAADRAVQKARALAATGPEHERRYVEALARRYSVPPQADRKALNLEYKNAMGELVRRYPDDLDAATLFAEAAMVLRPWRLWTADGKLEDGTSDIVATLESVLRRDPNHIGAIHYYIHAVEASPHPEWALGYAQKLPGLVPAAGHLVHMPAHIYERIGDYVSAAQSNREAARADEAFVKTRGAEGPSALMYYSHNLHFLAVAESMAGRFSESMAAARKLEAHVAPHLGATPAVEVFLPTSTLILVRFRKWSDVLTLPKPESAVAAPIAYWHFARGMALASTGDPARAEKEHQDFLNAEKSITEEMTGAGGAMSDGARRVADHALRARIAGAKGDPRTEIDLLRKGVEIEDALGYDEPPAWYLPIRESLGAALLRNGQAGEAERVFRADLERNKRNGRSLFGLIGTLTSQGRAYDALFVRQEFERAWQGADTLLRLEDL